MDVTPPPPHSKIMKQQKRPSNVCHHPPTIHGHVSVPGVKHVFALSTIYVLIFFIELYYILLLLIYIPPSPPTQHSHCITKPPFPQSEPPSPAPSPPTP